MASVYGTDNVVFFGGWNGSSGFDDTWVYDLSANTWTKKYPSTRPNVRYFHKMSTIYGTDQVLLFGGGSSIAIYDDTWVYDLSANTWTNKNPSGSTPTGRYSHSMAHINGTDNVVLFGGRNLTIFSDTWVYDLSANSWTSKSPSTSPSALEGISMASVITTDKVMLFGGWTGTKHSIDTWIYDLSSNNWNKKSLTTKPINTSNHGIAFIENTDKIVLIGGNDWYRFYDDTWVYDLSDNKWVKKLMVYPPAPRNAHGMATIYSGDKLMLFGGNADRIFGDTWIYDLSDNNWTKKYTTPQPYPRTRPALASIIGDDKVVLFGGSHSSQETWVYDQSADTWTEKSPTTQPSGRIYHSMASIYNDDKLVLFGGWDGNSVIGDTWVYDLSSNTWTNKNPSGSTPSNRIHSSITHICGDDKVVLFGGIDSSSNRLADTWIYDLSANTWTQQTPSTSPSARISHRLAPINGTKKVMMFGGITSSQVDETWIYDLREDTWTKLILSTKPIGRSSFTLAPIENTDKIVLFGGYDGTGIYDDTWAFGFSSYLTSGTFVSEPFESGTNALLTGISWNGSNTGNTDIKFQIRSAPTEPGLSTRSFVGPDGTVSTFYTTSPTNIWVGHQGNAWIQYKAYLSTADNQETPRLKDVTILHNYLPITTLDSPGDWNITWNNRPLFSWIFNDSDSAEQMAFQVQISDDQSFNTIIYDSGEQSSNTPQWSFPQGTSYTIISDGIWYWKVRTRDSDGGWGAYSVPFTFVVDACAPSSIVTCPANDECINNIAIISGTSDDQPDFMGIDLVEIAIKSLSNGKHWDGSKWITTETWLTTTGTDVWSYDSSSVIWTSGVRYNIRSRATDIATNVELPGAGINFTFDSDRPMSTIETPVDNSYLNQFDNISGMALDPGGVGIDIVHLSIKRTSDDMYWNGIMWIMTQFWLTATGSEIWYYDASNVKWSTDTQYVIQSRATDIGGNIEHPSFGHTFMYDTEPPTELVLSINDGNEYTGTTSVKLSLFGEDSGSGIEQMAFSSDSLTWTDWEPYNTSRSYEIPNVEGEYTVYYKTQDRAGNTADPVYSTIYLDLTPPDQLSIVINDNKLYTNSNLVTIRLKATDLGSGVGNMSISNNGIDWSTWEPFTATKSITVPLGDGEKTVFYRVDDLVGNIAEEVMDTIILDTIPPETISIVVNNGEGYTNSKDVELILQATDSMSGIDNMSFSLDQQDWQPWESFNQQRSFSLPSGDGEKTIYFRVNDNAGNIATVSGTITLDTAPPHSISISINDDATETSSTAVTLSLSALDDLSGAYQMSFSTDGVTWSTWENCTTPKEYTLSSDYGEKKIYYRVRDRAGNIATPEEDSITLVKSKKDDSDEAGDFVSNILIWLILIIIIIVVLVAILFFRSKRQKEYEQQGEAYVGPPQEQYPPQEYPPAPAPPPQPTQTVIPPPSPPYEQTPPPVEQMGPMPTDYPVPEGEPAQLHMAEPLQPQQYATYAPIPEEQPQTIQQPPPPTEPEQLQPDTTEMNKEAEVVKKLDLLEERLLAGEVSEETYLNLKGKYEQDLQSLRSGTLLPAAQQPSEHV
jgi:uncharacterized membrane protein